MTSIQSDGNTGVVTMEIEPRGLPIHEDATLKIRPRLFLEGSWFVELQPGSPSAKTVSLRLHGPVSQTSDPVQLDQVLDALNTDTRENLQNFLIYYGEALTVQPGPAENAEQEPEVRGINAAQALNQTYARGPKSLRAAAVLNQANTGTTPHDLSKLIASIGKVTAALNVHEQDLSELIPNFNTFFAALASQSASLKTLVAELPVNLALIDRGLRRTQRLAAADADVRERHPPGHQQHQRHRQGLAALDRTGGSLARAERARRRRLRPGGGGAVARKAVE